MLKLFTTTLLLLWLQANGQSPKRPRAGIFGIGWAGYINTKSGEGGVSLTRFIPAKEWAPGIQVSGGSFTARNKPADYVPASSLFGSAGLMEDYVHITPQFTRLWPIKGRRWLLFAGGGPSLVVLNRYVEFTKKRNPVFFGSNYEARQARELRPGLHGHAGIMMRVGGIGLLHTGVFISASTYNTTAGLRLGWGLGSARKLFSR